MNEVPAEKQKIGWLNKTKTIIHIFEFFFIVFSEAAHLLFSDYLGIANLVKDHTYFKSVVLLINDENQLLNALNWFWTFWKSELET